MTTTYIILIVYLGIMLAIGFYGRKYASTTKAFLNAGKQGTME